VEMVGVIRNKYRRTAYIGCSILEALYSVYAEHSSWRR
jgi:hypothetical protein